MQTWKTILQQFPLNEQPLVSAIIEFIRSTLSIQDPKALAEMQPEELVNLITMITGDNTFTISDDLQRLTFAQRLIAAAQKVITSKTPATRPATRNMRDTCVEEEDTIEEIKTNTTEKKQNTDNVHKIQYNTDLKALKQGELVIKGKVRDLLGRPVANAKLVVNDVNADSKKVLTDGSTDNEGNFEIRYLPNTPANTLSQPQNIQIQVYARHNELYVVIANSEIVFNAKGIISLDIEEDISVYTKISEYSRLKCILQRAFENKQLCDLTESDIDFFTKETLKNRQRIEWLINSEKKAFITGISTQLFYALQCKFLPVEPRLLYSISNDTLIKELEESEKEKIIDLIEEKEEIIKLEKLIIGDTQNYELTGKPGTLINVFRTSSLSEISLPAFVSNLIFFIRKNGTGSIGKFMDLTMEQLKIDWDQIESAMFSFTAGEITRKYLPIIKELQSLRKNGEIYSCIDLALWDNSQWLQFIKEIVTNGKMELPSWSEGSTQEEKLQYTAAYLSYETRKMFDDKFVKRHCVWGRITNPDSKPASGAFIQIFYCSMRSEIPVCPPKQVSEDGSYKIILDPWVIKGKNGIKEQTTSKSGNYPLHLKIKVSDAISMKYCEETEILFNTRLPLKVDIVTKQKIGLSEFAMIDKKIKDCGVDVQGLSKDTDFKWLAGVTGIDLNTIKRFAEAARKSSQSTAISHEVVYGLIHPASVEASKGHNFSNAFKLDFAVSTGIISKEALSYAKSLQENENAIGNIDSIKGLQSCSLENDHFRFDLAKAAKLPIDVTQKYSEIIENFPGKSTSEQEEQLSKAGVSESHLKKIRLLNNLQNVIGSDITLIGHLIDTIQDFDEPEKYSEVFAAWDYDDWFRWLTEKYKNLSKEGEDAIGSIPSPHQEDILHERAIELENAFLHAYPTKALISHIKRNSEKIKYTNTKKGDFNYRLIHDFLVDNPTIDICGKGLFFQSEEQNLNSDRLKYNADMMHNKIISFVSKNVSEEERVKATENLKFGLTSIQRLSKIASPAEAITLFDNGIISARQVATMSRESLKSFLLVAQKPSNRKQTERITIIAEQIHTRAQKQYARALSAAAAISPQLLGAVPSSSTQSFTSPDYSKNDSDTLSQHIKFLFGNYDSFVIPKSMSVLGSAAYLVDMLELIEDNFDTADLSSILFKRRNDIGEIELSISNSETEMPYIDLVIELLESVVSEDHNIRPLPGHHIPFDEITSKDTEVKDYHLASLFDNNSEKEKRPGNGNNSEFPPLMSKKNYPQTTRSAEELKIYPEHVNSDVYESILIKSVYPWILPFNLANEEANTYLESTGIKRFELIELMKGINFHNYNKKSALQIATQYLQMCPSEVKIITAGLIQNEIHFKNYLETGNIFIENPEGMLLSEKSDLLLGFAEDGSNITLSKFERNKKIHIRDLFPGELVYIKENSIKTGSWKVAVFPNDNKNFLRLEPFKPGAFDFSGMVSNDWVYWGFNDGKKPDGWPEIVGQSMTGFLDRSRIEYSDLVNILLTDYVNPVDRKSNDSKRAVKITLSTSDVTNVSQAKLEGITIDFLNRFHRFVRLWKKCGMTVQELDHAITILGTPDITDYLIINVAAIRRISEQLKLTISNVLSFFGNISVKSGYDGTKNPPERLPSVYERLFLDKTRSAKEDLHKLSYPFNPDLKLQDISSAICTLIGMNDRDYKTIIEIKDQDFSIPYSILIKSTDDLLTSISKLYRLQLLISCTSISLTELFRIISISRSDPLNSPVKLMNFLKMLETIKVIDIDLKNLEFLLYHRTNIKVSECFEVEIFNFVKKIGVLFSAGKKDRKDFGTVLRTILKSKSSCIDQKIVSDFELFFDILDGTGLCVESPDNDEIKAVRLLNNRELTFGEVKNSLKIFEDLLNYNHLNLAITLSEIGRDKNVRYALFTEMVDVKTAYVKMYIVDSLAEDYKTKKYIVEYLYNTVLKTGTEASAIDELLSCLDSLLENSSLADIKSKKMWKCFARLIKCVKITEFLNIKPHHLDGTSFNPYKLLRIESIPVEADPTMDTQLQDGLFNDWVSLCELKILEKRFQERNVQLNEAFKASIEAPDVKSAWASIAHFYSGTFDDTDILIGNECLQIHNKPHDERPSIWLAFLAAIDVLQNSGISSTQAQTLIKDEINLKNSSEIFSFASRSFSIEKWKKIAVQLRNKLRIKQRDALVEKACAKMDFKTKSQLQYHLLVDVEIGVEQYITRIALAVASLQQFIQRVFLGQEKGTGNSPIRLSPDFESKWSWMKNYQNWRLNREHFLYPENWLECEPRDNSTQFFTELQQSMSQRDLNMDTCEDLVAEYLQKLDDISRMEIMGTCIEDKSDGTQKLHIIARTRGIPHTYYHCIWDKVTNSFTSWCKIELDIDGDWVLPVIIDGRLNLYWIKHLRDIEGMKDTLGLTNATPFPLEPHLPMYQDKYHLSWSTRKKNKWISKKTAEKFITRPYFPYSPANFAVRLENHKILIGGVTTLPEFPTPEEITGDNPANKSNYSLKFGGQVSFNTGGVSVTVGIDSDGNAHGSASCGSSEINGSAGPDGVNAGASSGSTHAEASANSDGADMSAGVDGHEVHINVDPESAKKELERKWNSARAEIEKKKTELENSFYRMFDSFDDNLPSTEFTKPLEELLKRMSELIKSFFETISFDADAVISQTSEIKNIINEFGKIIIPVNNVPEKIKRLAESILNKAIGDITTILKNFFNSFMSNITKVIGSQSKAFENGIKDIITKIKETITENNLQILSNSGMELGFEFGYFDVRDGVPKSYRLSPLPNMFSPASLLTPAFASYIAPIFALEKIAYTLFPGYPALFDIPVKDNQFFTDLPIDKTFHSKSNPFVNSWPGTGYFPNMSGIYDYLNRSTTRISLNLKQIAKEELGKDLGNDFELNMKDFLNSKVLLLNKLFGSISKCTASLYDNLDTKNIEALLNTGMRIVKPIVNGNLTDRLTISTPVIICDERHMRSFIFLPSNRSTNYWNVYNFYHPLSAKMNREVEQGGIESLYNSGSLPGGEIWDYKSDRFYQSFITKNFSGDIQDEDLDFSPTGVYSVYNWELFFYIPMLIGSGMVSDQQFENAMRWFKFVFDPTASNPKMTEINAAKKFWRFKPFHLEFSANESENKLPVMTIPLWLKHLSQQDTYTPEIRTMIETWLKNPFNPFITARTRPGSFERFTIMRVVETLIAWGDKCFTEDTWESINEATQIYLFAREILGEKPRLIPAPWKTHMTYNSIKSNEKFDSFGNALVEIEASLPSDTEIPGASTSDSGLYGLSGQSMLYFGIPVNEKLFQYWDTIEEKLFRIRHSLNIKGKSRENTSSDNWSNGSSISNSIDSSASEFVNELSIITLPVYRFQGVFQKAKEFVGEVRSLASAYMSAIEKNDSETLSHLRATQEIKMLRLTYLIKEIQIHEAELSLEEITKRMEGSKIRYEYYRTREYMNLSEKIKEKSAIASSVIKLMGGAIMFGAAAAKAIPNKVSTGAGGHGNSPNISVSGGSLAEAGEAFSHGYGFISSALDISSALAAAKSNYDRRFEEWEHQKEIALNDIEQNTKQIEIANERVRILSQELKNHEKQLDQAQDIEEYLKNKFNNKELYDWMSKELNNLYIQSYRLAFDMAKRAELCYQFERGSEKTFINHENWDSLKNGLLSGEKLYHDMVRLEEAYLNENLHDFDLVKTISLTAIDPEALISLKNNQCCDFKIPEWIFDIEQPGHYKRRIKSVTLSIPCIVGPYNSVNCTLSLIRCSYRKNTLLNNGTGLNNETDDWQRYTETKDQQSNGDPRFVYDKCRIRSIVTSTSLNDSGIFDNNRDDKYMPFEGAGVISEWYLELPKVLKQFDYSTISDVILQIKYTACDGGREFKEFVEGATSKMLKTAAAGGFWKFFDFKYDFSNHWNQLIHNNSTTLELSQKHFPYFTSGYSIKINKVTVMVKPKDSSIKELTIEFSDTTDPLNTPTEVLLSETEGINGVLIGSTSINFDTKYDIKVQNATMFEELILLFKYSVE